LKNIFSVIFAPSWHIELSPYCSQMAQSCPSTQSLQWKSGTTCEKLSVWPTVSEGTQGRFLRTTGNVYSGNFPGRWIQSVMVIYSPSSFWTQGLGSIQGARGEIGIPGYSAPSIVNTGH
jgi:hypothetical protein